MEFIVNLETSKVVNNARELIDGKVYRFRGIVDNKGVHILDNMRIYIYTIKTADGTCKMEVRSLIDLKVKRGDIIEADGMVYSRIINEANGLKKYTFLVLTSDTHRQLEVYMAQTNKNILDII